MIPKMPIVAVTNERVQDLLVELYALGYVVSNSGGAIALNNALHCLSKMESQISHIWVFNGDLHPWSIWACGKSRPFNDTLVNDQYNLTLVNSPRHMVDYIRRYKLVR